MKGPIIRSVKYMVIELFSLALLAQAPVLPPAGSVSLTPDIFISNSKALSGHSFHVDNLIINIDIRTSVLGKGGVITLRVQNASAIFQEFNVANLIVVNGSGLQVQLRELQLGDSASFIPIKIAPHAHIIRYLSVSNAESLGPTLRVYFGDTILAKITD